MIISEKQILKLIYALELSVLNNLSKAGVDEAIKLIYEIRSQQSEELKVIE